MKQITFDYVKGVKLKTSLIGKSSKDLQNWKNVDSESYYNKKYTDYLFSDTFDENWDGIYNFLNDVQLLKGVYTYYQAQDGEFSRISIKEHFLKNQKIIYSRIKFSAYLSDENIGHFLDAGITGTEDLADMIMDYDAGMEVIHKVPFDFDVIMVDREHIASKSLFGSRTELRKIDFIIIPIFDRYHSSISEKLINMFKMLMESDYSYNPKWKLRTFWKNGFKIHRKTEDKLVSLSDNSSLFTVEKRKIII